MIKLHRTKSLILAFLIILSCFSFLYAEHQSVSVGFFAFPGYHQVDEDGLRSGYGYEFLQRIKMYTDWTYEYVGYDQTWAQMQQLLDEGVIDLLTSAQKTPSRELKYEFSDRPIGYSATMLTIRAGFTSMIHKPCLRHFRKEQP